MTTIPRKSPRYENSQYIRFNLLQPNHDVLVGGALVSGALVVNGMTTWQSRAVAP